MADVVTPEIRSRMMANIRSKNTRPELEIRKGLHAKGYRYRLYDKSLPGTPDLVLKKYNCVIFINGCFWHGHGCRVSNIPKSNSDFWLSKIKKNLHRDKENLEKLLINGWRVLFIWECSIRGKAKLPKEKLLLEIIDFLHSDQAASSIQGTL